MVYQRVIEVIVGLFMLMGLLALLFLALRVSGLTNYAGSENYMIKASFTNIGDLKARSAVTIAGVKVGYVTGIYLDPKTFKADVSLRIKSSVKLPVDTSANILTEGLLGSNYISLAPGYESQDLKNGDTLSSTHPAIILENLIGQLMYKISGSQ